jgi:hypothetical protein
VNPSLIKRVGVKGLYVLFADASRTKYRFALLELVAQLLLADLLNWSL